MYASIRPVCSVCPIALILCIIFMFVFKIIFTYLFSLSTFSLRTLNISYTYYISSMLYRIFLCISFQYSLSLYLAFSLFPSHTLTGKMQKFLWFNSYISIFLTVVSSILSISLKVMTVPLTFEGKPLFNSFIFVTVNRNSSAQKKPFQ